MKKILLLSLVCLGLLSCTKHRLYRRINRQFDGKDTITVRMTDIVSRSWDTMYVFQPMSHHPGRKHYHEFPYYHDIGRRIVFVKDGVMVFREDEVAVSEPYTVCLMNEGSFFTPETAVFRAVRVTDDTLKKHIELHSIK